MPDKTELDRLVKDAILIVREARRQLQAMRPKPPGRSLRLVKPVSTNADGRTEGRRVA